MSTSAGQIDYTIDAKTTPYLSSIKMVKDENKSLEKSFDAVDSKVKQFERSLTSTGSKILANGKVVNAFGQENKKLTQEYALLNKEVELAKQRQEAQTAAMARQVPQMTAVAKSVKQVSISTQNLGYQIQDAAVMMQYGASPWLIMSTQLSQLLTGPMGAMIGALAAITGGIMLARDAAQNAGDSIEEMVANVKDLVAAEKDLLSLKLTDEISKNDKAWSESAAKTLVLERELHKLQQTLKDVQETGSKGFLDGVINSEEKLKAKISDTTRELTVSAGETAKLERNSKKLNDTQKELKDGTLEHKEALKELRNTVKDLNKDYALQLSLIGKTDREQEKLRATAKLGENATKEQIESINKSIDALYNQKDAFDASKNAQRSYNSDQERVIKTIQDLTNQQEVAKLASKGLTKEATVLAATQMLGSTATKAQRDEVASLAASLYDLKKAQDSVKKTDEERLQEAKKSISSSPAMTLGFDAAVDMENLQTQYEAGLVAEEEYLAQKLTLNQQYEESLKALQEERFRAESEGNAMLMDGLDALGATASNVFGGMLSGTMTAKEALSAFAQTIMNQAIGALVQMGLQYIKNQIIEKSAIASTTATAAAAGSAMAASYAPAAAMASLASFGSNSAPAMAGMTATTSLAQGLAFGGGRSTGGPTSAGTMYELGEGNRPEIWQTGGKLYGVSGNNGRVLNQNQLSEIGGGSGGNIVIHNYSSNDVSVNQNGNETEIIIQKAVQRAEANYVQQFNSKQGPYFGATTRNTTATPRL